MNIAIPDLCVMSWFCERVMNSPGFQRQLAEEASERYRPEGAVGRELRMKDIKEGKAALLEHGEARNG